MTFMKCIALSSRFRRCSVRFLKLRILSSSISVNRSLPYSENIASLFREIYVALIVLTGTLIPIGFRASLLNHPASMSMLLIILFTDTIAFIFAGDFSCRVLNLVSFFRINLNLILIKIRPLLIGFKLSSIRRLLVDIISKIQLNLS